MLDSPTGNLDERDYVSPLEVVAATGLSLATVRRYIDSGRLPSFQPGGPRCRVLIPVEALNRLAPVNTEAQASRAEGSRATTEPPYSSSKPLPGPKPKWQSQNNLD
jgi:hypothetical protein